MSGLYELATQRRFIEQTGFHHPKTGKPYPPEHPRYRDTLRWLEQINMAMDNRREASRQRE